MPKNLEFDGKTNWTLFKQKFESYASAAGWNDEKKTGMLIWGLKGKAADFYVLLNSMNEDLTYKHLMSEFGKRFKIISHYKKIGYNINVLQQTACLVVNPITVGNFAFLFNCTPVGRTSDSMMVPT